MDNNTNTQEDGGTEIIIISGPDAMAHFRMCQHIAALRIQARTGMVNSRGSVIKSAQQTYGVKGRTASTCGAALEALYEQTYGTKYGAK